MLTSAKPGSCGRDGSRRPSPPKRQKHGLTTAPPPAVRRRTLKRPRLSGRGAQSAAPPPSAARGSPMRIRRCGSVSEAWRARASRTSRERRPTEGPQRTSGGDALSSPERPRLSVAEQNRLHLQTRRAKSAAGRQMSRRWTFSPQDRPTLLPQQSGEKLATLLEHPPSPPPHQLQPWRGHAPGPCTIISAAPLSSAARGSPMRIRRCGCASEAWRAKASKTSSERRPMEGPQRTSGGDALGPPSVPYRMLSTAS